MTRRHHAGPVCRQEGCREERLQYYTDHSGVARERCPSCGEDRAIPRRPAPPIYVPVAKRAG
jgi:hypothetical protein